MSAPTVSIVIPTKNSGRFLEATLQSIGAQTYRPIEVVIVDGASTDNTLDLAEKFDATVLQFDPKLPAGTFDAPHRRNHGAAAAKGDYVYYVDADMELEPEVVAQAVTACKAGAKAVIVKEDSFGVGVWAEAKNLERRCYWGDDSIEAPRFFPKTVWDEVGGLDESLGGGGDDWDLHEKLKDRGYQVARIDALVRHNEGPLGLKRLMKKRFMYGRDAAKYVTKRPSTGAKTYFPIRPAYIRNWRLFTQRPKDAAAFVVMRTAEYGAGGAGIIYSAVKERSSRG